MSNEHIARAIALRNRLGARLERERRTLIDMGFSPDLAAAVMDTPRVHHAIFAQRKYLAKNWAAGTYKRAHNARKVSQVATLVHAQVEPKKLPRPSFDDIFGAAA